ncbi:MAG: NlpC/P60 family protein [Specibacter sp.]
MAVACTLLASGGFVGAGYANTSMADAASTAALDQVTPTATVEIAADAGFDSFAAESVGIKITFANTLILAQKPKPKVVLDLTNPDASTPQLGRPVTAMRGDVPEISVQLMSTVRKEILEAAYQGLGHSYVWGGTSFATGWDCSGFVQWAYAQAGVALPRTEQWLPMVKTNNPQPGDLVVQNPDGPNHWSHIGIYIGNGHMISALNPSVGTIMHTPAETSSSSTYFTMPGFAALDKAAKDKSAKDKAAKDKAALKASSKTEPAKTAKPKPSKSTAPPTTHPSKTPPATTPPVTTPTTPPKTTPPVATPPVTSPPTPPKTTPPVTTPATTPPATTSPPGTSSPPRTTAPTTTTTPGTTLTPSGSAPAKTQSSESPSTATESASTSAAGDPQTTGSSPTGP